MHTLYEFRKNEIFSNINDIVTIGNKLNHEVMNIIVM